MYISVNIATHEPRLPFLRMVLQALSESNTKPNEVNIYFGECKIPSWVLEWRKHFHVHAISGKDLGASGKFYSSEDQKEGVYITLDDDLIPDPAYIGYLADAAMRYPNCIVGLHGTVYPEHPVKKYYEGGEVHYCYKGLDNDIAVDILGTGALAFRSALESRPVLKDFPVKNSIDPHLCKKAKDSGIPLVCLARADGFVKEIEGSQDSAIWKEAAKDDSRQTKVLNEIKDFSRFYERNPIDSKSLGNASIEWHHLKEILSIVSKSTKVVEFGSGKSTAILSKVCDLLSFEHNPDYRTGLNAYRPIKNGWYNLTANDKRAISKADVIVLDGPTAETGRYNIPKEIILLFKKQCVIFVDDCHREKDLELTKMIAKLTKKKLTLMEGKQKSMAKIK